MYKKKKKHLNVSKMKQPLQVLHIHVKSAPHPKSSKKKQGILTPKADTDTNLSPHYNPWYHSTVPQ
jgi:hypothetical protein